MQPYDFIVLGKRVKPGCAQPFPPVNKGREWPCSNARRRRSEAATRPIPVGPFACLSRGRTCPVDAGPAGPVSYTHLTLPTILLV